MSEFFASDEFWLNTTNALLGLTTLVCVVAIGRVVWKELAERKRVNAFVTKLTDDHVFAVPELGITMADGGTRIDREKSPEYFHRTSEDVKNESFFGDEDNIIRSEN